MFEVVVNAIKKAVAQPATRYSYEIILPPEFDHDGEIASRAYNVSLPGVSLSAQRHPFTSYDYEWSLEHYQGENTFNISFYEYEDGRTWQFIRDWYNFMVRPDGGGYYPPIIWQKTIEIHCIKKGNVSGLDETWLKLKAVDAAPLTFYKLDLGYDASEVVSYEIQFACRRFEEL